MGRTSVRQLWKAKLDGTLPSRGWPETGPATRAAYVGRVLGIDPSLRGTGLAVVEFGRGAAPVLLSCRTVRQPARRTLAECLGDIHRAVAALVAEFDPRHVALEQTIYVQNVRTAQILGAARGAAIAAAALQAKEIFEYPPLRVKQAVVGRGHASKEQMARTVTALLALGRPGSFDEADAVGVAVCHAFTWRA